LYDIQKDKINIMGKTTITEHPHIVKVDGICGGEPVIEGTRVSVKAIIEYYKLGMGPEEILDELPHLSPAQVFDALSYYHDHQEEIEKAIQENMIHNVMKKYSLQMDEKRRLVPKEINE
jgi:uncharacterized protein (DUF433 family)